jgi:hypothetical protein
MKTCGKKNVARLLALLTVTIVQSDVNMFRTPSLAILQMIIF